LPPEGGAGRIGPGTLLDVTRDDGSIVRVRALFAPWRRACGIWGVRTDDGRRGGYDLDRCSVVEGPYTEAMEAGADERRAIVEWLNTGPVRHAADLAGMVERGEHHRHLAAAPD